MSDSDLNLIRNKKDRGYGLTNSEISALHHADRIPRRPVVTPEQSRTPIVNQLIDRVHTLRPDASDASTGGGSTPSTTTYPFQPVITGTSATITYGTLNGIAPTNISSTFTIPSSGVRYLSLDVVASSGGVSSSTLSITSSAPSVPGVTLGFPPNSFSWPLYYINNQVLYRLIGLGSVIATSREVFRVQKSMPTPDNLPYDSYYTWLISNA